MEIRGGVVGVYGNQGFTRGGWGLGLFLLLVRLSIADMASPDQLASRLFFIVGTGRSGTTLLQAMLSSHPHIVIPPETKFFQRWDPQLPRFGGEPLRGSRLDAYLEEYFASEDWQVQNLTREEVEPALRQSDGSARSLFLALMKVHQQHLGRERMGEKSPLHCRSVERIHQLFPEAKFIHIYRDPRDVVASMLNMDWTQGTVRGLSRTWFKIMCEHLRLLRVMPSDLYTDVRFETLVAEPQKELQRLCEFLDEPFDLSLLHFYERDNAGFDDREAAWKEMTRKPLTSQSIGRFRRDLTMRRIARVERIVGPLLQRFGYQPCAGFTRVHNPLWELADGISHLAEKLRPARHDD